MSKTLACLVFLAAATPALTYRDAGPDYVMAFPRDHANHPDFKTEWWYYTGHLDAGPGATYGYELTFFRVALPLSPPLGPRPSKWRARDMVLAHFAVSDEAAKRFHYFDRRFRAGLGLAGAADDRYAVHAGTWSAALEGDVHHVVARQPGVDGHDLAIDLQLRSAAPPVLHGVRGLSTKADCAGCASHYYSLPRLATRGTLAIGGRVRPVTGLTWMDHEFGAGRLKPGMQGWDWCGLQFDDGTALMLYTLRDRDGRSVPQSSGTWIAANGRSRHLRREEFAFTGTGRWTSPRSGGKYPMGWAIKVPGEQLEVAVTPAFEDQELDTAKSTGETYWEGSVHLAGTRAGKALAGRGFVELTGYVRPYGGGAR